MVTSSGQINFYKFELNNGLDSSPILNVKIHTDRTQISENYITLCIPDALKVKAALDPINTYVNNRIKHLGASLVKLSIPSYCNEVLAGRANAGDIAPSHIKVSNYMDARRVIDDLFNHNEMSPSDRAGMEDALRELEKSGRYASLRAEYISIAQREIIQSMVSPYIDDIKSEAPDNQTAKSWVRCAANAISVCGPSVKDKLSSFLWTACKSGNGKSEDFYECLFAISKIYTNMSDLESALEQSGETMPSKSIIQQTILDLLD